MIINLCLACNSPCRTCKINEDFTNGNADYCTSCNDQEKPILDVGADTPTCVHEVPSGRALAVIRDNKLVVDGGSETELDKALGQSIGKSIHYYPL